MTSFFFIVKCQFCNQKFTKRRTNLWKLYQKCLENIELAFEAYDNIPDKLRNKWDNRKKMCMEKIKNAKETEEAKVEPIELSYPAHSDIPFIAQCLEMGQNEQYGRFIKTTRDLYPGDCIILEPPSAVTLEPKKLLKRCEQCLIENYYSLIPCPYCTAAMYCSPECRDTAYKSHHRFKCSAMNGLTSLFNVTHLSALNVVLKLFANQEYLDKTIMYLNNFSEINSFNFNYKTNYDYADEYKMLHCLLLNESLHDMSTLFECAGIVAVLYKFVKTNKHLKEIFDKSTPERDYEELFLKLLSHNLQISSTNYCDLRMIETSQDIDLTYGSAAYPFSSFINHSCAPNIVRFQYDKSAVNIVIVLRKIGRGEQLFTNYGVHHYFHQKDERKMKLLYRYNFKCACDACKHDWKLFLEYVLFGPHLNFPHIITPTIFIL